ncbi:type VI secretion system tube protein TssD [Tenacibaculum maritimum]|uniref:type VI secretion system tube protein TssD n=1 Tax=Tenacibaculum maritimum TaxID=107401 RepID=UPI003875EF22
MANSTLHFLGLNIDLFYIDTVCKKDYDRYKGIPVFYNQGGLLYFEFPYGEAHSRLLERMLTINYELYKRGYPLDDGKVMFYDANGDILKKWQFKDAAIVYYKVTFDSNGGGMMVKTVISPAIQDYGCKIHRWWHVTPIEEETYQSPIVEQKQEEKTNLKFIARFERLGTYNGEFGFDWMRDNYLDKEGGAKGICNNQEKLKKEYFPTSIHEKEYFVPSLSMFPNQEGVILKLSIKEKEGTAKNDDIIKLPAKNGIRFEPKQVKVSEADGKQIKVICDSPLSSDVMINLLDKNDKKVGAINVVKNDEIINLSINLVLASESRHIDKLKGLFNDRINNLEDFLQNRSFNQAFIKPYLTNNLDNAPIISLDDFGEDDYNGTNLSKKGKSRIIEKFEKEIIFKSGISIFLIAKNHERNQAGDSKLIPLDWSYVFMYVNAGKISDFTHEIGHALGLTHTFIEDGHYDKTEEKINKVKTYKRQLKEQEEYLIKNLSGKGRKIVNNNIRILTKNIQTLEDTYSIGDKNPYKFTQSGTDNFMDYYNDAKSFYRWQWDVMFKEAKKYYSN